MELVPTLQQLSRNPGYVAHRPSGMVIAMNDRQVIFRIFIPRPYKWVPKYGDLIANDWEVEPMETLQRRLIAARQAESA